MYFRDAVAGDWNTCPCGAKVLKPRRKCNACRKTKKYATTELRPTTKGKNARGVCLHKPDKIRTKRAKGQRPPQHEPIEVRMSNWRFN